MVIALMSATFERVHGETESHILRAKLRKITSNYFRLSQSIKDELKANKYILLVDVDPEAQPAGIESDTMQAKLDGRLQEMEQNIERVRENLVTTSLAQVAMNDRICGIEQGIVGLREGMEKSAENQRKLIE